ncbi:MAG: glycerophosphodiester phosphodiesterase family protein [Candidatus Sulfopaludibacter sp.]|nr:glycerophosphodiester phosphodiesterase family protein [Candidatus Sulfopaludibacter sp.]
MRPLVHGHRGARALLPENTLPAFEYAIGAGVDAVELDVAVTSDNILIVSHDPILAPPLCSGPAPQAVIRELTLAEVKQWNCGGAPIPTLDEVFTLAAPARVEWNIEIKSYPGNPEYSPPPVDFARLVLERIREHRLEQRVIVQSFDFRTLRAVRDLAPAIRRSALTEDDPRDFVTIAREAADTQMVSPHYSLVTPEKVAQAHAAGIQAMAWTVNTPEEWARMAHAQVDAVITDDPAALIAFLKARSLR